MTEELVSVAGPPRFVKLVAEVISGLLSSDTAIPDAIEVYPLKYAWAYDTKFESNGTQLTVPGVATVLQQLLPSYASGALGMAGSSAQPTLPTTVAKLTIRACQTPIRPPAAGRAQVRRALPATSTLPGGTTLPAESAGVSEYDPLITYDVRLNAVVVRDTKARLRSYGDVIAALDKPVRIIQIQATIIDINVDYSLKYGNQFLFTGKAGSFRGSASLLAPAADGQQSSITDATANLIDSAGDVIRDSGLNFSSIVMTNAIDFINKFSCSNRTGWPTFCPSRRWLP
jgi:type III secretion protein C